MNSFFARFKNPGLVPWLFIILATFTLTSLGVWQMQRLLWKETMLAGIEAGQKEAPLTTLPKEVKNWEALTYKRVQFIGELDRQTYFLRLGMHKDVGSGFYVESLFRLPVSGGKEPLYILANRGFIGGTQAQVKAKLASEKTTNPTMLMGILRPAYAPRVFSPKNRPEINVWTSEEMPLIEAELNKLAAPETTIKLAPLVIEVTKEQGAEHDAVTIANKGEIRLRNDHLGYAVTWFSLALVGVVMFGFYCRKNDK
jgi:surfeit locus 1 family protein